MKPAEEPRPRASRTIYSLWAAGFSLLLLLGFVCWFYIKPMLEARSLAAEPILMSIPHGQTGKLQPRPGVAARVNSTVVVHELDTKRMVAALGGKERAARGTSLYLRFFPDDDFMRRWVALGLLARCGKAAIPTLMKAVHDPDAEVRSSAIGSLCVCAAESRDAQALSVVIEALSDPDKDVRAVAAGSLGNVGSFATGAVPGLRTCLVDHDPTVITAAARSLWQITGKADESLTALEKLRNSEDEAARDNANYLIAKIRDSVSPDKCPVPKGDPIP